MRNIDDFQGVGQALADKVNTVAAFDATARRCSLAIEFDVTSGDRGTRLCPGLEEAAIKQPPINAQRA